MDMTNKVERVLTVLESIARDHAPAAFANSFGAEDMVLTDLIARHFSSIEIFTLDTGRLPEETHSLMREIVDRYNVPIRIYYPDREELETYVHDHGPNAFYRSVELRKGCCNVRKVIPLQRALAGKRAWITGMRREQSPTRTDIGLVDFDSDHGLQKFNPLFDWTRAEVWAYIRSNEVPYNALHDRGYASVGCAPCTRAITVGEDERAGRWWWEDADSKECGLHVRQSRPAQHASSVPTPAAKASGNKKGIA